MRKQTSILCLILSAVLLLSACSRGADETASTTSGDSDTPLSGKYVETDITPDDLDEIGLAAQRADGTLIVYDSEYLTRYESTDNGASWNKSDGPGTLNPALPDIALVTLTDDDSLIGEAYNNQGIATDIVKIASDGTVESLALDGLDDMLAQNAYTNQLETLPDGKLLLSLTTGITAEEEGDEEETSTSSFSSADVEVISAVYDLETGKKLYDLDAEYIASVAADSDYLYLMDYENTVNVYQLSDGSEYKTITPEENSNDDNFAFSAPGIGTDSNHNLYIAETSALMKLNAETGTSEKLMDGSSYSFGVANSTISKVLPGTDSTLTLALRSGGTESLKHYSFDENAADSLSSNLQVWALTDNETVRAAIRAFQTSHPDVNVEFETGLTGEGIQDAADAIRNLNTRILAGDGPDVIILDDCPAESYATNGIPLDLSDKLDTSGMYEQLTTAGTTDEGTFFVPTRFQIPVLLRSDNFTDPISSLEDLSAAVASGNDPVTGTTDAFSSLAESDRPVMSFDSVAELTEQLWASSYGSIIKDGAIDSDNLETFLQTVSQIADKYNLASDDDDAEDVGSVMIAGDDTGTAMVTGSALSLMIGRSHTAAMALNDLTTLMLFDYDTTTMESFPGLETGTWIPNTIAGVNAGTDQEDLAVAFIQTLLDEEVQATFTTGIPVTAAGVQSQLEKVDASRDGTGEEGTSGELSELPDMDALISTLTTPVLSDTTLIEAISEPVISYCKGNLALEETVKQIEQDTKNYLAERES